MGAIMLATAVAACSDPAGPCDAERACEVAGVDLAVEIVEPVEWADGSTEPLTGLPLVAPGEQVVVHYRVRNRGDAVADSAILALCWMQGQDGCHQGWTEFVLGALEPGAVDSATVSLPAPAWRSTYSARDSLFLMRGFLIEQSGDPQPHVDAVAANDAAYSIGVYLDTAWLMVELDVPAVTRIGDSIAFVMHFTNFARVSAAPPDTIRYCMNDIDADGACIAPHHGLKGEKVFPGLAPGATLTDTARFWLEPAFMGGDEDVRWQQRVWNACLVSRSTCGFGDGPLTILPNLDLACDAQPIVPGDTVAGTTTSELCDLADVDDSAVYSFDALAGATYRAALTSHQRPEATLAVVDRDGTRADGSRFVEYGGTAATFTVPETGRYHILVAEAGAFALSLQSN